jgi:hypothetical protein
VQRSCRSARGKENFDAESLGIINIFLRVLEETKNNLREVAKLWIFIDDLPATVAQN